MLALLQLYKTLYSGRGRAGSTEGLSTTAPPHLGGGQRGEQEEGDDAEDPAAPDCGGEIERIADAVCEQGFDSIYFTSSGGSLAMMQPFDYMISVMSDIPVQSQISADLLTAGNRRIGKGTLAFMASKSGDTKETVAAAA